MKGLYLRDNIWWFRFSHDGIQHRISTNEVDELRAIEAARKIEAQPALVSCTDLWPELELYLKSLRNEDRSINYVNNLRDRIGPCLKTFEGKRSVDISRDSMQAWFDLKLKEVKPITAVRYLDDVRRFFAWLVDKGKVRVNPCDKIEEPKARHHARKVWIDGAAAQKLLDYCQDQELKYIIHCAVSAGMRKEEVIMSQPSWFSLDRKTVTIPIVEAGALVEGEVPSEGWRPKDKTERTIPLQAEFLAFLESYPMDGLYMIGKNKVKKGKYRYRFDFRNRYNNYVKAQGLKITFHDLRRSFASRLASAGVSLYKIAKWLGDDHKTVEDAYAHLQAYDDDISKGF